MMSDTISELPSTTLPAASALQTQPSAAAAAAAAEAETSASMAEDASRLLSDNEQQTTATKASSDPTPTDSTTRVRDTEERNADVGSRSAPREVVEEEGEERPNGMDTTTSEDRQTVQRQRYREMDLENEHKGEEDRKEVSVKTTTASGEDRSRRQHDELAKLHKELSSPTLLSLKRSVTTATESSFSKQRREEAEDSEGEGVVEGERKMPYPVEKISAEYASKEKGDITSRRARIPEHHEESEDDEEQDQYGAFRKTHARPRKEEYEDEEDDHEYDVRREKAVPPSPGVARAHIPLPPPKLNHFVTSDAIPRGAGVASAAKAAAIAAAEAAYYKVLAQNGEAVGASGAAGDSPAAGGVGSYDDRDSDVMFLAKVAEQQQRQAAAAQHRLYQQQHLHAASVFQQDVFARMAAAEAAAARTQAMARAQAQAQAHARLHHQQRLAGLSLGGASPTAAPSNGQHPSPGGDKSGLVMVDAALRASGINPRSRISDSDAAAQIGLGSVAGLHHSAHVGLQRQQEAALDLPLPVQVAAAAAAAAAKRTGTNGNAGVISTSSNSSVDDNDDNSSSGERREHRKSKKSGVNKTEKEEEEVIDYEFLKTMDAFLQKNGIPALKAHVTMVLEANRQRHHLRQYDKTRRHMADEEQQDVGDEKRRVEKEGGKRHRQKEADTDRDYDLRERSRGPPGVDQQREHEMMQEILLRRQQNARPGYDTSAYDRFPTNNNKRLKLDPMLEQQEAAIAMAAVGAGGGGMLPYHNLYQQRMLLGQDYRRHPHAYLTPYSMPSAGGRAGLLGNAANPNPSGLRGGAPAYSSNYGDKDTEEKAMKSISNRRSSREVRNTQDEEYYRDLDEDQALQNEEKMRRKSRKGEESRDSDAPSDVTSHDAKHETPKEKKFSGRVRYSKKDPAVKNYFEKTDKDVIFGQGGEANNHPGNQRYLKLKERLQAEYLSASTKALKTQISQAVVDAVHAWGGKFLKRDTDSGKWFEATNSQAREKASQSLREINTPEVRAARRAKYGC